MQTSLDMIRVNLPIILLLYLSYTVVTDETKETQFKNWIIAASVVCFFILQSYIGAEVYKDQCDQINIHNECVKGYYYKHTKKYY